MHSLHLVSHTHWDREWYLTFQQFHLKLVHLVDHLLDILRTEDEYAHFMLDGQTIVLEDYLQMRPECESELRRHIQEGRILIGPWYILPDEFLVSPEATIRNLLEGDRIASQYGPKMMVGYIPDPFGHIGQMPQILKGFGIETASVMRGLSDEPCEFWWQAPDGSKVLMGYLRNGYGNAAGALTGKMSGFAAEMSSQRDALSPYAAGPNLLLMQGTDHMEPQRDTPAAIAFANHQLQQIQVVHSTLPDYFQALQTTINLDELPVISGELRSSKRTPLLPGVLSTRMWIKQRNRACETLLEKWAEPFSTWAEIAAPDQKPSGVIGKPASILREAWRLLMQCHPHDSICGCSIDQVHDEMRPRFDQVEQIGEEITAQCLATLAAQIDTRPSPSLTNGDHIPESAVIVFNPVGGPRTDQVRVVIETLSNGNGFEIVDELGNNLPFQVSGLGSQEFINMVMDPKEFQAGIGMVSDGIVMGLVIREMNIDRQQNSAEINLTLSEHGEPDLEAWEMGRSAVESLLKDPSILSYHIHASSAEAAQVTFKANQVPAYGYKTYWVREKPATEAAPLHLSPMMRLLMPLTARVASHPAAQSLIQRWMPAPGSKPPYQIQNEYFRVEAQPDGTLDVLDKTTGALYKGQNRLIDGGDRGDEYNYSPPESDLPITARLLKVQVEKGDVFQSITLWLRLDVPESLSKNRKRRADKTTQMPVKCQIRLSAGVPRIDIHTEVENNARDHRLRVHFAAPFPVEQAAYDGHFEIVHRPVRLPAFNNEWIEQPRPEVPQRAFTSLTGDKTGLLIANRGLPEAETLIRPDGNAEIALTLLRCVGWLSRDDYPERKGHAGPAMETPGAQMPGKWSFDYAIIPHRAQDTASARLQAYAFEVPMRAVNSAVQKTPPEDTRLPAQASLLQVEPQKFILSAVKTSQDGSGYVVRGSNLTTEECEVSLTPLLPFTSAEQVNLAEQKITSLAAAPDHHISFKARGNEIISILFR